MQHIFQNAKRLIAKCLITLLLVNSILLSFPASARAGNITVINCNNSYQPNCGNTESPLGDVVEGVGYLAGLAGDIAAISSMGAVSGLGGAGITSGLAAIGSLVGGGMVAGVAVTAVAPAVAAVTVDAGLSYIFHLLSGDEANAQSDP